MSPNQQCQSNEGRLVKIVFVIIVIIIIIIITLYSAQFQH